MSSLFFRLPSEPVLWAVLGSIRELPPNCVELTTRDDDLVSELQLTPAYGLYRTVPTDMSDLHLLVDMHDFLFHIQLPLHT